MVNNILIFRTDKIGDLLITCPVVLTIKKHLTNSKITLITSKNNHNYAKSFGFIDDIVMFPQGNLLEKFKFIISLSKKKYNYILILDGKDRSIISSIFISSQKKVAIMSKKRINFFWKLFNIKFIEDDESTNLIKIYQNSLKCCNINTNISNFDYLKHKIDNNFSGDFNIKKYIQIHLDEKWIKNLYIEKYKNINPSYQNFTEFLISLSKQNNILITTGMINFELINSLKSNFFKKKTDKIYYTKVYKNEIYLVYKPSLIDLESLVRQAQVLITCHGAISHIANSFNVKMFDIIDESKKDWYSRFSSYMNNYNLIYRDSFNLIHKKIINDVLTL